MTLPDSQKLKESPFKAFKNEEKETKKSESVSREELAHMAKCVKETLKLDQISNRKQDSRNEKIFDKSFKEKDKDTPKGKRLSVLIVEV